MLCLHLNANNFPFADRFVYANQLRDIMGFTSEELYKSITLKANLTFKNLNTDIQKRVREVFFAFAHEPYEHFLAWHAFSSSQINQT
jgi:hypothetical protein